MFLEKNDRSDFSVTLFLSAIFMSKIHQFRASAVKKIIETYFNLNFSRFKHLLIFMVFPLFSAGFGKIAFSEKQH